jgi:hypothetical protein
MKFEDALHAAKNNIVSVTKVKLKNASTTQMNEFAQALARNTSITTLQLVACTFELEPEIATNEKAPPYAFASLAQAVSRQQTPPTLTDIEFNNCGFITPLILRTPATDLFFRALANNQSVTRLCIANGSYYNPFRVNPYVLKHLLATNRTLKLIYFRSMPDVAAVEADVYTGFVNSPKLQELHLESCDLGSRIHKPTALIAMISQLRDSKELLDLSGSNYYSENDIEAILLALENNPHLNGLSLDITSAAQLDRMLQVLSQHKTGLTYLGICSANFADMRKNDFARLVRYLPQLVFHQCRFTPAQVNELVYEIEKSSTFERLDLRYCKLTDEQAAHLFTRLSTHPTLTLLSLIGNELSDGCAEQLIQLIKANRHLTTLNLCGNGFSAKTLQTLQDEVSQHTNITKFAIDGMDTTITSLNVQIEKALAPFSSACQLCEQSPESRKRAMRLNLIPAFIQSHQNLRQLVVKYPEDVARIETALNKLERDSLEIVRVPEIPSITRFIVALTALAKPQVNSEQLRTLLGLLDMHRDALLQNCADLIEDGQQKLVAPTLNPDRLYVAMVLSVYQLAYEKSIHLPKNILLSTLNLIEKSDSFIQVMQPAELTKRIKQQHPAVLAQLATEQPETDSAVLNKFLSIPEVVAMLYRDKIIIDGFEAVQLNGMVLAAVHCSSSQLIAEVPSLFAQQLEALCNQLSAKDIPQSEINSHSVMTQAVTPLINRSGKGVSKEELAELRADTKRFDRVKIRFLYDEVGTETLKVTLLMDARPRVSDRLALRPPSASNRAPVAVSPLSPAENAAKDIADLTEVVSFLRTAAPELGINEVSYPVIKDDNSRGVVLLNLSKKQLAPLVTLLKEWKFVDPATPIPTCYQTQMEQQSQALQATATQLWGQVISGSAGFWDRTAPQLQALMNTDALQKQVKALMGPKPNN